MEVEVEVVGVDSPFCDEVSLRGRGGSGGGRAREGGFAGG